MRTDAETRRKVLLTPDDLQALMESGTDLRILAVQSINPYTGAASRDGTWIPGAVDINAYTELAAPASPERGQRPLPDPAILRDNLRRWGIRHGQTVVLYDNDRAMTAARGWWVLKWAGIADVRVLDGGLPAWKRAGKPVADCPYAPEHTDIDIKTGRIPSFGADDALGFVENGVLLDARIRPNYIGGPIHGGDPKRGHIPGAISAPTLDTLTDPGPFADSATLAELFTGLGVREDRPVGVYCGAGMSAAHTVLALAAIGIEAAMYPGSWSEWINDSTRPVQRGPWPK